MHFIVCCFHAPFTHAQREADGEEARDEGERLGDGPCMRERDWVMDEGLAEQVQSERGIGEIGTRAAPLARRPSRVLSGSHG